MGRCDRPVLVRAERTQTYPDNHSVRLFLRTSFEHIHAFLRLLNVTPRLTSLICQMSTQLSVATVHVNQDFSFFS